MKTTPRKKKEKNPALKIRDFYSFSQQILNEINYAREHPDEFLEKLRELYDTFKDTAENVLYLDGVPFFYSNLKGSLEGAMNFLEKQKGLPPLIYNRVISQACDSLLNQLIIHDGIDDDKKDNYNLEKRLNRFGVPLGEIYELIDYGMFDPEFIVINFVLCDGDPQKYERNVIFNPKIKYLGIASSILPSEKICTVINFCEEFFEKDEVIPIPIRRRYEKSAPKFSSKTIDSSTGKMTVESTQEMKGEDIDRDIDDDLENFASSDLRFKRRNSGNTYKLKKDQYNRRKQEEDELIKQKEQEKKKEEKAKEPTNTVYVKKRDARIPLRKKKTVHQPKYMDVITEELNDDDEDFKDIYDREFDIKIPIKQGPRKNVEKVIIRKEPMPQPNSTTSTVTTTDDGKKVKKTTTTTTETDENGRKVVTTTVTEEEVDDEPERYVPQRKVKEIPTRLYPRKSYPKREPQIEKIKISKDENLDDEIERHLKRMEKEFGDDFGDVFNPFYHPAFESTDDMFEKEDEIDFPEGAVDVKVKQKTITDSRGNPVLMIHKTITFEDGSVKTTVEKKKLTDH